MARAANRRAVMQAPVLPEPGQRVGVVCGPGEFARDNSGMTLCQVTDRWGTHAIILMDDGTTKTCHGLNSGPGIGYHLL
jgi:hypothetical protein